MIEVQCKLHIHSMPLTVVVQRAGFALYFPRGLDTLCSEDHRNAFTRRGRDPRPSTQVFMGNRCTCRGAYMSHHINAVTAHTGITILLV